MCRGDPQKVLRLSSGNLSIASRYDTVTYDVSLYVSADTVLSSDLVFFLQVNPTLRAY